MHFGTNNGLGYISEQSKKKKVKVASFFAQNTVATLSLTIFIKLFLVLNYLQKK